MGIESVFKSMAGADWNSVDGGGLSAKEFGAFLKDKAGADGAFDKSEFSKTAKSLGLSGDESKNILEAFGKDGQISVDKFRSLLEKSAGSDKAFNLDELKGGLEKLSQKAEDKVSDDDKPVAKFGRDAGADKQLSKEEFEAQAENAGVSKEDADKAFDEIAGDDGKVSKSEFKDAFGDTKVGKDDFAKTVDKLAGGDDADDKPFAKFGRDAGADKKMDKAEFEALADKAGVSKEDADKAFDKFAGADGVLDKSDFKGAFGDSKVSEDDFKSAIEDAAGSDEECGCSDDADAADDEPTTSASSSDDASDCDDASDDKPASDWSVQNGDGQATINLGDKYTITANEADSSWTVKNNETGKETKISGDPHVDAGNDGNNDFDFHDNMSFKLDDGTKITVGTTDAGNGTTYSSSLTITNGDNAITVNGLAQGDGDGKLTVSQSMNGESLDDDTDDGSITIDEAGSGWTAPNGDVVDQDVINKAEA